MFSDLHPRLLLPAAAFALASLSAAAASANVLCYADPDGDGYYGDNAIGYSLMKACEDLPTVGADPQNAGDCGPFDGTVHPRNVELADGLDNDCDGEVDEPALDYAALTTTDWFFPVSQPLLVTVNDQAALDFIAANPEVFYTLEVSPLIDESATHVTATRAVDVAADYDPVTRQLSLDVHRDDGLEYGTIYRARLSLLDDAGAPLGPVSEGIFLVTGESLRAPDLELRRHRREAALIGLNEVLASRRGEVGHHGVEQGGSRYGAPVGKPWCDQFYSWVVREASEQQLGFEGLNSDMVRGYFRDPLGDGIYQDATGALMPGCDLTLSCTPGPDSSYYDDGRGQLEDYYLDLELSDLRTAGMGDFLLAVGHAGMFLAWDPVDGTVFSLEGNVGNTVSIQERPWNPQKLLVAGSGCAPNCPERNYWVGLGRLQELMFHPLAP